MFHKLAHDIYTATLIKLAFKANQNNFTHGTSAVFSKTTKRPDREPDKKSPKKGSDSEYWVTPMGIVRGSDHWGTVGTCNWDLAGSPDHPGKKVYGFSPWENFNKKTAALDTIQHYTKSGPKDQVSKSVSQWHDENPEAAEAFLLDLYNKLGWKNNNPAKYMKTRHELENWMYEQLPQLGIKADTKYPTYGSLDLGYTPEVFQDMNSHLDIPLKGLEDKVTFSIGDSIPVLGKADPASRKLYSLKDIQSMPLNEVIEKVKASTNNSRGQNYLEAQIWTTPEELQQVAKLIEKTGSKKVLKGYYDMTPEEQEAARNSLKDNEVVYLSSKPIGRGYEGSAYPVLTKDLGEAIRKNFNGCYGETPHLQRMIELKGNKIDQQVRDLFDAGEFEKAYELYAADNPRKRMKNRLAERMQVLMNPDNADLFAALAKAQPRRVHENIGGGIRAVEPGLGSLIMEKLKVQDDSKGFTEADFISMNTDLAERIMKAHIGDKPAYGTDFPEKFTTPNGKIGPNMRFAPILRGADGKLYQVKDIRNVFDKMALPEMFRSHETAFHNAGLNDNNQLKIFDFGTKPIEEA